MATCPNCGYKLRFFDWKPDCPKCKVNLVYYGMEEKLQNDADKAEAEHARVQKKIDRLKASFVGSPLTLARLILSAVALGPLFLTLCKVNYSGPFIEQTSKNINILSLYNFVSSLNFDSLFAMFNSALVGKVFIFFLVSIAAVLLSAVLIIVSIAALTAACGPKGNIRNITLNVVMIVLACVSAFSFTRFSGGIHSVFPEFYSGTLGIGAFVYIAALSVVLAINIIIAVKGVDVKYKQTYVGGIPSEEYFRLVEEGTDKETLREMMADALLEQEMDELRKRGIITDEEEAQALEMAAHELEKEVTGVDEETAETVEEAMTEAVEPVNEITEPETDIQE
ncbi:MAG: hypothetical protein IJK60_11005 [Clostridia bacterium]|nr:hypothetical protein [Clostridia bacterium]MBR0120639.1 hypothetical protein [Clostridia bacterium]